MTEPIHPDIRDLPTGSMMVFPADVPLPEGWQKCDGHTVRAKDHVEFVTLMNALFKDADFSVMNPAKKVSLMALKNHGFKVHKDAIVLPDFRGKEGELAFGTELSSMEDLVIGIRVGK